LNNTKKVILADLNYITENLNPELSELSNKRLMIAGGAGFLGYYLVQAILHWNKINSDKAPINLVVYDNFMRGVPDWLEELRGKITSKSKNMM